MSPSTAHISSQLRQLIYYHLDNNLVRNALFLAGRLHAYEPRAAESSYLLALCHLQSGQVKAAYDYSKNFGWRGTHLGCAYVFAQACLDLGKYPEGITALERSKGLWSTKNHWGTLCSAFLCSIPLVANGRDYHFRLITADIFFSPFQENTAKRAGNIYPMRQRCYVYRASFSMRTMNSMRLLNAMSTRSS